MRNRISRKLIERLVKEGFIPDAPVVFQRLYPGHWQRSSGAWVWTIVGRDGYVCDVGSSFTASHCLQADKLEWGVYGEIVPGEK